MNERWVNIPCHEAYQVSSMGLVRSKRKGIMTGKRRGKYLAVELYRNGTVKYFSVHTIVLLAFVGPRPDNMECCHNDGNPHNNSLSNLRWGSKKENAYDRIKHGTAKNRDNGHYASILSRQDVEEIKRDERIQRLIAADYGVGRSLIANIKCGITA